MPEQMGARTGQACHVRMNIVLRDTVVEEGVIGENGLPCGSPIGYTTAREFNQACAFAIRGYLRHRFGLEVREQEIQKLQWGQALFQALCSMNMKSS